MGLNAPTGAGCSLTRSVRLRWRRTLSQCTYRCGVLPDDKLRKEVTKLQNKVSQCTYRCGVLPDTISNQLMSSFESQCTYRCVVLPDPCPRERRYDATSRARSATGPGSTPPDRPAPSPE